MYSSPLDSRDWHLLPRRAEVAGGSVCGNVCFFCREWGTRVWPTSASGWLWSTTTTTPRPTTTWPCWRCGRAAWTRSVPCVPSGQAAVCKGTLSWQHLHRLSLTRDLSRVSDVTWPESLVSETEHLAYQDRPAAPSLPCRREMLCHSQSPPTRELLQPES